MDEREKEVWPAETKRMMAEHARLPKTTPTERVMEETARLNAVTELHLDADSGWDLVWYGYLNRVLVAILAQGKEATFESIGTFIAKQHGFPDGLTPRGKGERYAKILYAERLGLPDEATWLEIAQALHDNVDAQLEATETAILRTLQDVRSLLPSVDLDEIKKAAFGSSKDFSRFLQERRNPRSSRKR